MSSGRNSEFMVGMTGIVSTLCLLASGWLSAQRNMTGLVRNDWGDTLAVSSVKLKTTPDGLAIRYGVANAQGRYRVSYEAPAVPLFLEASYVSYESATSQIHS